MSILNVEHLSHGFGDRAIFQDVSFRLLKGEHIGLIGANGEGKSTFMNIITGKLMPDEGKVEWAKNVRVGYLDQHAVLEKGMTIRDVLKNAFAFLFEMEEHMNQICDKMGEAGEEEMAAMMDELGTIQDLLMAHDFYIIDSKVEEVGRALGLADIGLDKDVTELSGGQRTKVLLGKLLLEKPDILLLDEPTNYLDVQHIDWLKRYLQEYENAFILISHDIPFLNSVINLIYHMENQRLDRYVGDYDKFQEVYAVKKAQLEAAYKRQQQKRNGRTEIPTVQLKKLILNHGTNHRTIGSSQYTRFHKSSQAGYKDDQDTRNHTRHGDRKYHPPEGRHGRSAQASTGLQKRIIHPFQCHINGNNHVREIGMNQPNNHRRLGIKQAQAVPRRETKRRQ